MRFEPVPLAGVFRIVLEPRTDERGHFVRRFCCDAFAREGLETDFVQCSTSFSLKRGTLRGLHYQAAPATETKLVRCTRGAAYDVILDLRRGSPTFGRWHAEALRAGDHRLLYVPRGLAHGFQTLEDATELDYEITPAYAAAAARGILWNDPDLAIPWPMPSPTLSDRDREHPRFSEVEPL